MITDFEIADNIKVKHLKSKNIPFANSINFKRHFITQPSETRDFTVGFLATLLLLLVLIVTRKSLFTGN